MRRKLTVLMVHTWHHRRGGDSTYADGLGRLLEEDGHRVVPLAMRHPENEPSTWERWFAPHVDFREASSRPALAAAALRGIWNPAAARSAAALIARVRPDVVHLQHVHHHLTPSVIAPARRAGIPVVWTVHDYELICPSGHLFADGAPCEACRGHRYHQAVLKACKRGSRAASAAAAAENAVHAAWGLWGRVDAFLCPSRFLADKLVAFGVPAERVHHRPNFLPVSEEPPPGPGRGWLYAGRLAVEKGVIPLMEAARRVPDQPLTLCGSGPLEDAIRRIAPPNVRLRGHLPAAQLAGLVAAHAVVVVPSLWYENFPYAVLEAQAAGRAVVASRIGGIPEQITDGVDGLLVPPGDPAALAAAVQRLLGDPDEAGRIGRAGWKRVRERLDPSAHREAVLGHYARVMAR